ncbi:tRNA (adenosine(37)-N6)-threonylcarbamoyltransferase complex dimerization subunit type 1 TsaB [Paenochrobactrum sp. BZR 588]|uniref:tRNA (adenosine(37)-N6)-threonylcarbamoyltransferase complex dimerization subunit type 1 TsaB n=1 Tax=Paenochrobactrum TaxID=999488 RepID=UPI0035BC4C1F
MKILALDTAASFCAAALYDSEKALVLAQRRENIGKGHAEVLMAYVQDVLEEARLDFHQIDRVAVNVGPGSFTGVRIAVSSARGFALALNSTAIGVTAFEALCAQAHESYAKRPVLVLLDAHRGEIFAQSFDGNGEPETEALALTLQEAVQLCAEKPDHVLTGSAAPAVTQALGETHVIAQTEPTADIAVYARIAATKPMGEAPKPLYLRGPDAKPQVGFALPRKSEVKSEEQAS